ncbi:MAG: hypothetical protein HY235_10730 [Acidobacteria bacterium]|nr:hypothetical protein [Acidobacteriota bacterium]
MEGEVGVIARRFWLVFSVLALFCGVESGCIFRRKITKSPYQVALEAYSTAGTVQELVEALPILTAELKRDPSDAQLRLLRASTLLRIAREQRLSAATWQRGGSASQVVEDLRRMLAQLSNTPSGLGWAGVRAYISAADLALVRAQTGIADLTLSRDSQDAAAGPRTCQFEFNGDSRSISVPANQDLLAALKAAFDQQNLPGASATIEGERPRILRIRFITSEPAAVQLTGCAEQKGPDLMQSQLQARALQIIARDFYAFAFQTAESLLRSSPGQAAPALAAQREHALEGYVAAEAGVAQADDRLDFVAAPLARLAAARDASLKGQLPSDATAFGAPISLEPRVHDRDWRILRASRPPTQNESLRSRDLALRGQIAASFLEEPGRSRHYTVDVLEDLITNLAAMRLQWTLRSIPSSQDELRILVERHPLYKQFTAPVVDFNLYAGDRQVLQVNALAHRPAGAGQRPGPVFVPPGGVTLVLHAGDASPMQTAPAEVHLFPAAGPRFDFLSQKATRLRVVDGFGSTVATMTLP